MKNIPFALLILLFLLCGCSGNNETQEKSKQMIYNFNEPVRFPFEEDIWIINSYRQKWVFGSVCLLYQWEQRPVI